MVKKMADKYDEELLNRFADVAEELGWTSDWDLKGGYLEMENYSRAGEDLIMTLFTKDFQSFDSLIHRLRDEWYDFNPDDHAAMWYGQNRGEPSSLRALLNDADYISEMLYDLEKLTYKRLFQPEKKEHDNLTIGG